MMKKRVFRFFCLFFFVLCLFSGCASETVSCLPFDPEQAALLLHEDAEKTVSAEEQLTAGKVLAGGSPQVRDGRIVYCFEEADPVPREPEFGCGYVWAGVSFDSAAQLVMDFASGNILTSDLEKVRDYAEDARMRCYSVLDLNDLYEPILPDDMFRVSGVRWEPSALHYYCRNETDSYVICIGNKWWQRCFKTNYLDFISSNEAQFVREETVSDRSATVTEYTTRSGAPQRMLRYRVVKGDKTIYVAEHYYNSYGTEIFPFSVELFICDGDQRVYVQFDKPTKRPAPEWIAGFGAKKVTDLPDLP